MSGNSEDMKGPCVFLASSASDYLNGAIIPVSGGYLVNNYTNMRGEMIHVSCSIHLFTAVYDRRNCF